MNPMNPWRSIIARMGNTQEFPRLKVGIGRPVGDLPIATYVLQVRRPGLAQGMRG